MMMSSRALARATPRTARSARSVRSPRIPQARFQSTSTSQTAANSSSHLGAGLVGGIAGASLLYGLYTFTPAGRTASKINKAAKEAEKKYQQAAATLKEKTPSTDQAIDSLKQFCYTYVAWVPGGRQYVDMAFKDIDSIREKHSDDVDKLVAETYAKFQDIAKSGLSMESASKTYDALADLGKKLAKLAGSAADQIIDNHPQLKKQVGGPISQLKQMGEQYGPEAKKMVDETWDQIGDILSSGFSADSVEKIRKLVEEKTQQLKKLGDQAWQKGMEQAKPYLEKNPKVKELVEKNQDLLKQGNATALFQQVKTAVESGDEGKLEDYVKQAVDKAKSTADKGASSLPGGGSLAGLASLLGVSSKDATGKIQEHIGLLSQIMHKESEESKKLLEETKEDLKRVLEEKAKKAQKIVDSAQKQ